MSVNEELETLRHAIDGCRLVAFADIDAQLVLVSSSETRASREVLDALCGEAATLFAVADLGDEGSGLVGADTGMIVTGTDLYLFVRDAADGTDALCFVCAAQTDVAHLLAQARATLPKVTGAGA